MAYHKKGYNILIVDVCQSIIDGLTAILKSEELIRSIQSANNIQTANEKVKNSDIDCVLMNINISQVNGQEATKIFKWLKREIKVIIWSMLCDATGIIKLLTTGEDAFITNDTEER